MVEFWETFFWKYCKFSNDDIKPKNGLLYIFEIRAFIYFYLPDYIGLKRLTLLYTLPRLVLISMGIHFQEWNCSHVRSIRSGGGSRGWTLDEGFIPQHSPGGVLSWLVNRSAPHISRYQPPEITLISLSYQTRPLFLTLRWLHVPC